jgi:hypothetical protein
MEIDVLEVAARIARALERLNVFYVDPESIRDWTGSTCGAGPRRWS